MKLANIVALFILESKAIRITDIKFADDEQPYEQNYINKNFGERNKDEVKWPNVPVRFNDDEDFAMENYNRIVAEENCKKENAGKENADDFCKKAVKTADGRNAF